MLQIFPELELMSAAWYVSLILKNIGEKNHLGQDYKKHHAEFSTEDEKYENKKQLIGDIVLWTRPDW